MDENPSRTLFVVGGSEDKLKDREILRSFVEAAGGRDAHIAIVPTASSIQSELLETYSRVFRDLGARTARGVTPGTRRGADNHEVVSELEQATGIFMTGGNQAKLTAIIGGTHLHDTMRTAYEAGVPVAGTSAGASAMASHMVHMGKPGDAPRAGMAQMGAGLGLLPDTIIDQHFSQRNRLGRLMSLVAASPSNLGIGVDENTCARITDGAVLEVLGDGVVVIVDGRHMQTNAWTAEGHEPLLVSGAIMHSLPPGTLFDLTRRRLVAEGHLDDHLVTDAAADFAVAELAGRVERADLDSIDDRILERLARGEDVSDRL